MAITEMFIWWYSQGWRTFLMKLKNGLANVADFFSMDSLIRTLFKPYRQISADSESIPGLRFQMFIDRLISRLIGFFTRLTLLIIGCITILVGGILSLFLIILWPFIPLAPIAGIVLTIVGVTP